MASRPVINNLAFLFVGLAVCLGPIAQVGHFASGETIQLSSILPKIQAIHEDAKSLLIKNVELKNKILAGFQAQNEAKILSVKEGKSIPDANQKLAQVPPRQYGLNNEQSSTSIKQQKMTDIQNSHPSTIDYSEIEEFNKWVEVNLEYAVKNTQATAEALKDEAQANNGNVEYTEQAVKDGIEGVKYWQAAVIFQDKTLKHEKFEPQLD